MSPDVLWVVQPIAIPNWRHFSINIAAHRIEPVDSQRFDVIICAPLFLSLSSSSSFVFFRSIYNFPAFISFQMSIWMTWARTQWLHGRIWWTVHSKIHLIWWSIQFPITWDPVCNWPLFAGNNGGHHPCFDVNAERLLIFISIIHLNMLFAIIKISFHFVVRSGIYKSLR